MRIRITTLALVAGLNLAFGQLGRCQSTMYFDRNDFMNACQGVGGIQQSISFAFPFQEGPSVTIGDVMFWFSVNVTFAGGA